MRTRSLGQQFHYRPALVGESAAATVEKMRLLTPEIALVHARWKWPGALGPEERDFSGILTALVVRRGKRWLVRPIQDPVIESAARIALVDE